MDLNILSIKRSHLRTVKPMSVHILTLFSHETYKISPNPNLKHTHKNIQHKLSKSSSLQHLGQIQPWQHDAKWRANTQLILLKTGDGSIGLPALDGRKATLSKAEEPTRNSRRKETVCVHLPDRMNKGATTWLHLLWPQPARGGTGRMLCQYTDRERDTSGFLLFPSA